MVIVLGVMLRQIIGSESSAYSVHGIINMEESMASILVTNVLTAIR